MIAHDWYCLPLYYSLMSGRNKQPGLPGWATHATCYRIHCGHVLLFCDFLCVSVVLVIYLFTHYYVHTLQQLLWNYPLASWSFLWKLAPETQENNSLPGFKYRVNSTSCESKIEISHCIIWVLIKKNTATPQRDTRQNSSPFTSTCCFWFPLMRCVCSPSKCAVHIIRKTSCNNVGCFNKHACGK